MKHLNQYLWVLWLMFGVWACSSDKAQMELVYSPKNATITIDGYSPDSYQSPHVFDFYKPGEYTLKLSAPGYEAITMRINVRAGETLKQEIHLVKAAPTDEPPNVIATSPADEPTASEPPAVPSPGPNAMDFRLLVESTPSDAQVLLRTTQLNSVMVLKTPLSQLLRRHVPWQVEVRKEGYIPVIRTVVGPASQNEVHLNIALQPHTGSTSPAVNSPAPPGQTAIAVDPPPEEPALGIPEPAKGWLSVQTVPWTVVSVNGKVIGNTPILNHELRPRSYKILMENRDLSKRKVQTITIVAGEHVRLDQEL